MFLNQVLKTCNVKEKVTDRKNQHLRTLSLVGDNVEPDSS